MFQAPWCGVCKAVSNEELQSEDWLAVEFIFDTTANEVSQLFSHEQTPTLTLYPKGKLRAPIEYSGTSFEASKIQEWAQKIV